MLVVIGITHFRDFPIEISSSTNTRCIPYSNCMRRVEKSDNYFYVCGADQKYWAVFFLSGE